MNMEFVKGVGMGVAAGAMIAMACSPSCSCHGHGKMTPKKKVGKFVKAVGGLMDDMAESMGM